MNTNEWQPIETAPKDGTDILVIEPLNNCYGKITNAFWEKEQNKIFDGHKITIEGYWAESCDNQLVLEPTHWMPLPKPPQK